MSKLDTETEMKVYKHLVIKCPKCNHMFLPWHTFGMNTPETGWEDALFCPSCHTLSSKKDYVNDN